MGRGQAPAKAIPMTALQFVLLQEESNKRTTQYQFKTRINLLLKGRQGQSNSEVARDLAISLNTVKTWRHRWQECYGQLCEYEKEMNAQGLSRHDYLQMLLGHLRDNPRSGTRKQISLEEEQQIVALASEKPSDYGIEMTNWTHEMLAKSDRRCGSYWSRHCAEDFFPPCGEYFKKSELQPHKSEYWLFPRIQDWKAFAIEVSLICNIIVESIQGLYLNRHVLSVDEKTGIQALERIEGIAPESKGSHRRREFQYVRHGTTRLMTAIDVAKGKVVNHRLHPTRNEWDFLSFIKASVAEFPQNDEVVILADQLNTHHSASLVCWIARQIGFKGDLGTKGYKGILKNMKTRKAFLENKSHRIRFVYTPKHCSWLNRAANRPIENWFAKLQRHVIRNGNFSSVNALENKIENYISFYNRCLLKPLRWKFKGFIKAKELKNLNYQEISS